MPHHRRGNPIPLTPADVAAFRAGEITRAKLGVKYGVSAVTARNWLRRLGVDTSDRALGRRVVTAEKVESFRADYEAGKIGIMDVAMSLSVPRSTPSVWRMMHRLKFKMRRAGHRFPSRRA